LELAVFHDANAAGSLGEEHAFGRGEDDGPDDAEVLGDDFHLVGDVLSRLGEGSSE